MLRNYSALLVKKLQDGDIAMDKLVGDAAAKPQVAAAVRVMRPVRKESLGMIAAPKNTLK